MGTKDLAQPSSRMILTLLANYFGNSFGEHDSHFIAIIETIQRVDIFVTRYCQIRTTQRDETETRGVVAINNKCHVGGALTTRSNMCFII